MKKRLLAFFLAFTMVFSIVPVTAFAAETKEPVGPFTEIVTDTGAVIGWLAPEMDNALGQMQKLKVRYA